MPDLTSVDFDHHGWQPIETKPHIKVWGDDIKQLSAVLSLEYFDSAPEIAVGLEDINRLRFVYRTLANQSGAGLISAEVVKVDGVDSIETVFKMLQPNRGTVYVGSLTIPFAQFSYVAKVQCLELGFTGVREAYVLDKLMESGTVSRMDDGEVHGWLRDPYDPSTEYPFMPNMSEASEYDAMFPQHALSRVRRTLKHVRETMILDKEVSQASPFRP